MVQVQSAFMIDLNQVSYALRNSTPRSLLILDEFGKGTLPTGWYSKHVHHCYRADNLRDHYGCSPSTMRLFDFHLDGAGLLCGVLEYLLDKTAYGDGEEICGHIRTLKVRPLPRCY